MLRLETKARARALQMLYAWELQGRPPMTRVAHGILLLSGPRDRTGERATTLAEGVAAAAPGLDAEIAQAAEHWRLERIGAVERCILRLGLHELAMQEVPAPVVIDEAVRLAHWFAGPRAPSFVNGVLDALARSRGRL